MQHVTDNVHLDVTFDGYRVESDSISFGSLLLTSDVNSLLPLMQMSFADMNGDFKKAVNIRDGMQIIINLGKTAERQKEYKFRMFSNKETTMGQQRIYVMTGYLDVPAYFTASSNDNFQGTASEVMQTIADTCGFATTDIDSTADSQRWYQANKRHGQFAGYVARRGYIDDGSIMVLGVKFDRTLMYKDFNRISGPVMTLAYDPTTDGNEAQIVDHKVNEATGNSNIQRGYADQLLQQDMDTPDVTVHKDIKVDPRASNVAVNSDIQAATERGRVEFTPPHFKDQAHDNYWKAQHQNDRGRFLNSIKLMVLAPIQLDTLDLLSPVTVRLNNINQDQDSPEQVRDGDYVVVAKHIIVEGINYAERFTLARAGTNKQG